MKNGKEKIISTIVLKYYKVPEKGDILGPYFKCGWCLKLSNRTGGGFQDKKGNLQQICENCAVLRYKEDNGFRTLASARARRRRIFDVGYLFNESVLDLYMKEKGIITLKKCINADDIFIKAGQLYNQFFNKEEKTRLEEMENQKDIQDIISKRIQSAHINTIFGDW